MVTKWTSNFNQSLTINKSKNKFKKASHLPRHPVFSSTRGKITSTNLVGRREQNYHPFCCNPSPRHQRSMWHFPPAAQPSHQQPLKSWTVEHALLHNVFFFFSLPIKITCCWNSGIFSSSPLTTLFSGEVIVEIDSIAGERGWGVSFSHFSSLAYCQITKNWRLARLGGSFRREIFLRIKKKKNTVPRLSLFIARFLHFVVDEWIFC